ncbi:MAG: GYD domain-containing protein [Candidatus Marinimicrobia bacterium]|nr:GYD domain-containing protein [Candidatus Neomarinimicrobiota bacterium]MBL7023631.1 GYD domain-containing protein [Candidatus Neomarinimicrobiota bacterium]MBL7109818.1 GYD domain-containing protein [Candidatus Neomarinimicrobiota bacterium]
MAMSTYYMFGKYSIGAISEMSPSRTDECTKVIEEYGGEIILMHALLGEHDLVFIVNFPDNESALKASLVLTRITGIAFSTAPATSVDHFDKVVESL